eukprot:3562492-Rhodomonas_salina.4
MPIVLCNCYAMSGTSVAYAIEVACPYCPTQLLGGVRYYRSVCYPSVPCNTHGMLGTDVAHTPYCPTHFLCDVWY